MRTFAIILMFCLTVSFTEREAEAQAQPNVVAECIIAVMVIVVGTIVIIKLKQLCDAKLGPPGKAGAPPANSGGTGNAVPMTANASQAGAVLTLNMTDDNMHKLDISAQGYTDAGGNLYTTSISGTVMASTNLTAWQPVCTITGWVSAATIVFVCYTNGVPTSTNWGGTATCDSKECGPLPPQRFFELR